MSPTDPADPRRPIAPLAVTPLLAGVALRRTTSVDIARPDGLAGRAVISGRGRDLVCGARAPVAVAEATIELEARSLHDPTITALLTAPWHDSLATLVGAGASAGFRARLPEVLVGESKGSLLWRLCTEVPNLFVIGGFPMQHERLPLGDKAAHFRTQVGVCAGFRAGGVMMRGVADEQLIPRVTGPAAPAIGRADEPLGWHEEPPLMVHAVRRHRRLDLLDGATRAQVWFRDTYLPPDDVEMVIHEYTLDLTVDWPDGVPVIGAIDVTAHVLPWGDCPAAVASAQRMVGESLATVAARGRRELHGETTCTHLNAAVGSIADLDAMVTRVQLLSDMGGA